MKNGKIVVNSDQTINSPNTQHIDLKNKEQKLLKRNLKKRHLSFTNQSSTTKPTNPKRDRGNSILVASERNQTQNFGNITCSKATNNKEFGFNIKT